MAKGAIRSLSVFDRMQQRMIDRLDELKAARNMVLRAWPVAVARFDAMVDAGINPEDAATRALDEIGYHQ